VKPASLARSVLALVTLVLVVLTVAPLSAQARGTVYLACGTHRDPTPSTKQVAPRSCAIRAYAIDIFQYVNVEFRRLKWRRWGKGRPTARGQYAVSGYGWNPVSLTASRPQYNQGKLTGVFYTRLQVIDTCRCGFIGPSRAFVLDSSPSE
jgi:hypothetical protein